MRVRGRAGGGCGSLQSQRAGGAGKAELTVTLTNVGAAAMTDVRLSPSETREGEAIDDIAPGKTAKFVRTLSVGRDTMANGYMDVYITFKVNGTAYRRRRVRESARCRRR